MSSLRKFIGVCLYSFDDIVIEGIGRQRAGAVTGMDTCLFDMFHNACNNTFLSVRDGIDIDLYGIFKEFVNKMGRSGDASAALSIKACRSPSA